MVTVAEVLAIATRHHQAGQFAEAEQLYRQILAAVPDQPQALHQLGMLALQARQFAAAIPLLERSLAADPSQAACHGNLGEAHRHLGQLEQALVCYQRAIDLQPDQARMHVLVGRTLRLLGRDPESASAVARAVELSPMDADARVQLGHTLEALGSHSEAEGSFRAAIRLQPQLAEAHYGLGSSLLSQRRLDEAAESSRQAIALDPGHAEAHNNLGLVFTERGQWQEAEREYRAALERRPDFAAALCNLGSIYTGQDRFDEAIVCYRRALEVDPGLSASTCTLGVLLARQDRIDEARECYRRGAERQAAGAIWKLKAAEVCPTVFASNDEIDHYRAGVVLALSEFKVAASPLEVEALHAYDYRPPFSLQFQGRNERPLREAYSAAIDGKFTVEEVARSGGRSRIGFVVTQGHEKAFLKSLGGVLERLDAGRFELVVLAHARGVEVLNTGFKSPAIRVVGFAGSWKEIAEVVRGARCDVLYYWEIGTDSTNYLLPFLRLAPVQCTSWGIQVTSGIRQVDYYLSSALAEPADAVEHYSEQLVLADTLLTYQTRSVLPDRPVGRAHFGLDADALIYLCAQQLAKFHPDFDPILAGILRRDPRAVIVGLEERQGASSVRRLRERFKVTLSDVAGRVLFVPFQPTGGYLCLLAAADVLLDPLHFGGVNSSYDAFSLNQPVVTLPSHFQRGRYTLACYKKMGLDDCVARDAEHYVELAVKLGTDHAFRESVVQRITAASSVLFEDLGAVREHERIFEELIRSSRE